MRRQGYPERDGSLTQVWQFNRELVTEYTDPTTGVSFTVPGVVMSVRKNVMRTEGLMVEVVLGVAPSLDAYNGALQDEALRERQVANEAALLSNRREQLAQQVVGFGWPVRWRRWPAHQPGKGSSRSATSSSHCSNQGLAALPGQPYRVRHR